MRIAFKEWAVVVDALGRGEQIIILRKGGIHEGRGGFKMEHDQFLLFPTLFHQQRESVTKEGQTRYDEIKEGFSPERVRIEYFAEVVAANLLKHLADAERLQDQHIWTDQVIRERFDWGKEKAIHAVAVRVYRLVQAMEIPNLPEYSGCKSWVTLHEEIGMDGAQPVLSDGAFAEKLVRFNTALGINLLA